jgi:hypothetical protein
MGTSPRLAACVSHLLIGCVEHTAFVTKHFSRDHVVCARLHARCRYLKSLAAVETRFPISGEQGNVRISFPWTDAFRPAKKSSQTNIHFEKAALLFNVAALTSQAALAVERGSADGVTQACKLFQVRVHCCLRACLHALTR